MIIITFWDLSGFALKKCKKIKQKNAPGSCMHEIRLRICLTSKGPTIIEISMPTTHCQDNKISNRLRSSPGTNCSCF